MRQQMGKEMENGTISRVANTNVIGIRNNCNSQFAVWLYSGIKLPGLLTMKNKIINRKKSCW